MLSNGISRSFTFSSWIVGRRRSMRVALLSEASRLHSYNLVLSTATVKADDLTVRDDCEESDCAESAGFSASIGATHWVLQPQVQGILLVIYYRTTACNVHTLNHN